MIYGAALTVGTALLIAMLALRTSVYGIELRYLMPTVPVLLIAIAALLAEDEARFASVSGERLGAAVAISLAALTLMNLVSWHAALQSRHDVGALRRILNTQTRDGMSAATLLADSAGKSPLMSNQSQQLYLALRRPTVGVPERRLSARLWTDADLQHLARRFDVRYIVLFKERPLGGANGRNDFVLTLARQHPDWTRSVLSTPELELLEVKAAPLLTESAR
jgi:hypothetical protein